MAVLELIAPDLIVPAIHLTRTQPTQRALAVRGEYLEIPMLSLTRAQVQSFWDLDDEACHEVLATLVACGFLKVTLSGSFVRA